MHKRAILFKIKNPTMIQLNRIQLASQTTNHVEITKFWSTCLSESRIIDCQCKKLTSEKETGYYSVSSIDWCKVYGRLAITFEGKFSELSSVTNNIYDTKKWCFPLRIYLINVSKSAVLCKCECFVHIY